MCIKLPHVHGNRNNKMKNIINFLIHSLNKLAFILQCILYDDESELEEVIKRKERKSPRFTFGVMSIAKSIILMELFLHFNVCTLNQK